MLDQYNLTDNEQQELLELLAPGNKGYAICNTCVSVVKIYLLRKKPEDKPQHASCLPCFCKNNPDLV